MTHNFTSSLNTHDDDDDKDDDNKDDDDDSGHADRGRRPVLHLRDGAGDPVNPRSWVHSQVRICHLIQLPPTEAKLTNFTLAPVFTFTDLPIPLQGYQARQHSVGCSRPCQTVRFWALYWPEKVTQVGGDDDQLTMTMTMTISGLISIRISQMCHRPTSLAKALLLILSMLSNITRPRLHLHDFLFVFVSFTNIKS